MNEKRRDLTKLVLCNFGGILFELELIHPHLSIYQWSSYVKLPKDRTLSKNEASSLDMQQIISCAVRGPDLKFSTAFQETMLSDYRFAETDNHDSSENPSQQSTVLMMRDRMIDLISLKDGRVLQSLAIDHLKDAPLVESQAISTKFEGKIARDLALTTFEENAEIRASIIHWCPYSKFVLVGYCSGMIGLLPFNDSIEGNYHLNFNYIRTTQIHEGDITLLKTFKFRYNPKLVVDPLEGDLSKEIVVALVGDAHGVFSLWQIYPSR